MVCVLGLFVWFGFIFVCAVCLFATFVCFDSWCPYFVFWVGLYCLVLCVCDYCVFRSAVCFFCVYACVFVFSIALLSLLYCLLVVSGLAVDLLLLLVGLLFCV